MYRNEPAMSPLPGFMFLGIQPNLVSISISTRKNVSERGAFKNLSLNLRTPNLTTGGGGGG